MKISDALLSDLKNLISSVEVELKPVVLAAHVTWLRDVADKLDAEVKAAKSAEEAKRLERIMSEPQSAS